MIVEAAIRDAVTLDFETERIEDRPKFPPAPVGLAVRYEDGEADYFAWGHPSKNNCDLKDVRRWMADLWRSETPLLFFNAKFDLAVAYEVLELPVLPWHRVHDAQFLAFLAEPHSRNLDLKSLAADLLDWPPDERDELAEWIWQHRKSLVAEYGGNITKAKHGPNSAGAWISKAPGDLVGRYAIGDVDRTYELFEHLLPLIRDNYMLEAYDRERKVLPIFMENEREGMHTDIDALSQDVPVLEKGLERADDHLRDLLDDPELNIDADAQFADALAREGIVDDDAWTLTKTGQKSVAKDNLTFDMFNDPAIGHLYFYRNRLQTALSTFLKPWLAQGSQRGGIISTNWNQVRGGDGGTRTGRPSSYNPNFLNIPKEFKQEYDMPEGNEWGLPSLPFARYYILPDPGQLFGHRDFDGQEMRLFAHYEDGDLLAAYQANPDLDPHGWVRDEIYDMLNVELERTPVKILNFQALYGGGVPAAAKALGCTLAKAKEYKNFHDKALPGREEVNKAIEALIRQGEPIRTWGNRAYFAEPSKIIDGRRRDFLYKLINYLCQGSAADVTKEALIRWDDHPQRNARFLVTVYDEINFSAYEDIMEEQQAVLREVMESIELDLIMKSSGKVGPRWGELEACE